MRDVAHMAILALLLVSGGIVVVGCLDEKRKRPD